MSTTLERVVTDWNALGEGLAKGKFPIPLGEIRAVQLRHEANFYTELDDLRDVLNAVTNVARGWLMLTEKLVHLPTSEPLSTGTPLQGEWHADGSSWQLRYLSAEEGWRLHQYTVSDPDQANQATHLAEPITHLKADGNGHIRYQKLWAIENDLNGEPALEPVLTLLTGYGENK